MTRMFVFKDLPRTMTKREWKELDRWLRRTERPIKLRMAKALFGVAVYGHAEWFVRYKEEPPQ
jgi:hypothetical protein